MSTEKIHAATVKQILKHYTTDQKEREFRHLDIGSVYNYQLFLICAG
jgi:hypothetical protein